jgi:hypothetical protein
MIRVQPRPEPSHFNGRVRLRGRRFLARTPHPTGAQWKTHDYWTEAKFDLHDAYNGICNFVCHWIPRCTGSITVEHFRPKARYPRLAYEWDNLRLMCGTLNGRKSDYQNVIDPFQVVDGMFVIEFPSLMVKPSDTISRPQARRVQATIDRLRLNDEGTCLHGRKRYVRDYCQGLVDFEYIRRDAPFIAYELERQGLVDDIKSMMVYP